MPGKAYQDDILIQYLLGQLSEAERARVEAKFFDDTEYFERLKIAEAELTDAYVSERLSTQDRIAFEKSIFASPGRRQRVAFAAVWREYIEKQPPLEKEEPRPFFNRLIRPWIWVPVTAVLLIVISGIWITVRNRALNEQINSAAAQENEKIERQVQQHSDAERQQHDKLAQAQPSPEQPKPTLENPPATNVIASITLRAGTLRSAGAMKTLEVHPQTKTIELIVPFKDDGHKSYSAVIGKASGTQILNNSNLRIRLSGAQKQAIWSFPAPSLADGDYLLTLRGIADSGASEDLAEYQFRVLRK